AGCRTCGATTSSRGGGERMKTYVVQRLVIALLTLLGMSMVIFALLRLAPGDIVDILFSTAGYVSPSEKQAIMKELGIDRPYWVQYLDWMRQMLTGDLGKSYRYDQPAWQIIRPLVPVTLELAALSTLFAVLIGVPAGVISAVRQDKTLDYALLPVVTVIGIEFAFLIGGLVVTETVFNLPGVARFLVQAILWRDYPIVQNLVMFIAVVVILSNLLVDMLYGVLDPRVRYGG